MLFFPKRDEQGRPPARRLETTVERGVAGAAERHQVRGRVLPWRPVMDHDAGGRLADATRAGVAREHLVAVAAEPDLRAPPGEVAGAAEPRDGWGASTGAEEGPLHQLKYSTCDNKHYHR